MLQCLAQVKQLGRKGNLTAPVRNFFMQCSRYQLIVSQNSSL